MSSNPNSIENSTTPANHPAEDDSQHRDVPDTVEAKPYPQEVKKKEKEQTKLEPPPIASNAPSTKQKSAIVPEITAIESVVPETIQAELLVVPDTIELQSLTAHFHHSEQEVPQPDPEIDRTPATPLAATSSPATEVPRKRFVPIGSQRDTADKSLKPAHPKAVQSAIANPIDLSAETSAPLIADTVASDALSSEPEATKPIAAETTTVETTAKKNEAAQIDVEENVVEVADIKSNTGFSDDIDAEIEAAISGLSMADVVEKTQTVDDELEPNTRVKGIVTKIHGDNVFFRLNGQFEGVATHHHFKNDPQEGDMIEVIIRSLNKEDNLYELAVPGAAVGVADWENITEGAVVDARVTGSNTGGLEVAVNSLRGFIPASQIDRVRVEDFSQYVNEKFPCVVLEVNPEKRKLVLSRRAILDRENEEQKKELLKELEAGQLRDGLVTRLMDFGAFVDLGGVEGLIHISKISWSRVKHPSEVVKVGEKVRVKIEKVDLPANRISLSLRDTLEHPWKNVATDFAVDAIVKGTVTRNADFGAFVKIAPGIEGLVHISELAYHRVVKVSSVVQEGQEIEVKILSIDPESQKISLSHKACLAPPAPKAGSKQDGKPAVEEAEEPARDLAIPNRAEPLKGGRDRKSGGEGIGLNW